MADLEDTDEDYYFEINITRSQLSDVICRNEDCKAARLFGERGIGPLAPKELKDPFECYEFVYNPPPVTRTQQTQSPKRFPCGDPKCKYLNVYPDGSPIGCGKDTCKYKRDICTNPDCVFNKIEVKTVCPVCGGYSLSGKTCYDMDPGTSTGQGAGPEPDQIPTNLGASCAPECRIPDRSAKAKLIPPASLLPFDQLQASARKERLVTMENQFLTALARLNECVMDSFEKYFDMLNPHIEQRGKINRGLVWFNNKFYTFYVEVATNTRNTIRELLRNIWNESVRSRSATIPQPLSTPNDATPLVISASENVATDLATFITNNFGMFASFQQFFVYIRTVVVKEVVAHKTFIPPHDIPSSPNLSLVEITTFKKKKRKSMFQETVENFYYPPVYGHRECFPYHARVPKDMGWAWNLGEKVGRLKPLRWYTPGAVTRTVAKAIKQHKLMYSDKKYVKPQRRKPVKAEYEPEVEPMLSVHKKQGCYLIKMAPCKNPYWTDEQNKEYSPLIFLVNKNRDKIVRVNPDGTEEPIAECDCEPHSSSSSSSTSEEEEEFEIQYTPPILRVTPELLETFGGATTSASGGIGYRVDSSTQYDEKDVPAAPKKKKGKK